MITIRSRGPVLNEPLAPRHASFTDSMTLLLPAMRASAISRNNSHPSPYAVCMYYTFLGRCSVPGCAHAIEMRSHARAFSRKTHARCSKLSLRLSRNMSAVKFDELQEASIMYYRYERQDEKFPTLQNFYYFFLNIIFVSKKVKFKKLNNFSI